MATVPISETRRWSWRSVVFTLLVAFFGLQSFIIGIFVIAPSPWRPETLPEHIAPWHAAQSAAVVGLLTGALLLAGLWHPERKPALFQLFAFNMIQGVIIALLRINVLGFELFGWLMFALSALILALYPRPRALWSLVGEGPASKSLFVLAASVGLLLIPDILRHLQWQLAGIGGEQLRRFFWLQTIGVDITLILSGLLVARKRPGWRILGLLLGTAYLYLGVVAMTIPNESGSWGMIGGALAVLAGISYWALTLWEPRYQSPGSVE
ncbi:MAG TPA: hypothetical protein PLD25_30285 [Chloroflexota bacterium]|nr:hypothetical protein [Chloroflexota bacterium]HUM67905.1 hypothetical protein [Chloroflexota bacterium]